MVIARPVCVFALAWMACFVLAACSRVGAPLVQPTALLSSQPPQVNQVEDAAFWIHPTDPDQSMLLISNKWRGLEQHGTDGMLLRTPQPPVIGGDFRGIDVMYGFPLSTGEADLVFLATQTPEGSGVTVWKIDPIKRKCLPLNDGRIVPVLDGLPPLGVWTACDQTTGRKYLFITSKQGVIEQHEITASIDQSVALKRVRRLTYPKVKAGVADEKRGVFYFAPEEQGVWVCPIDPETGIDAAKMIMAVGDHGMQADLAGLAIYDPGNEGGYLLVVSQGERDAPSRIYIYNRQPPHQYRAVLAPSGANAVYNSSGIAITPAAFGQDFPQGVLALKNRINPNASENFTLYPWPNIAIPARLEIADTP